MTTYPFRTLYELGVNFVAVAETSTFEYPEEIQPLVMPAVMSSTFDLEGIVALEPDLVLLPDSAMATHGATLQELGIPAFAVTTKEPDQDVYTTVKNQTEAYIEAFAQDETALAARPKTSAPALRRWMRALPRPTSATRARPSLAPPASAARISTCRRRRPRLAP